MNPTRFGLVLLTAALLGLAPGAATRAAAQDHGNPGTFYRGSAYLWWANIDGENQLGDLELTVGDSTKLFASFAGDFAFGKGRLRGVATFSTTSLSNQTELTGTGIPDSTLVNYDFSQTMAELFAWWQVGRFNTSQAFQLFGGLRYTHQKQTLLDGPVPGSFTATWVEPVGGAQYFVEMGGFLWATITGDIGGVLFGSRFAYGVGGELGAHVYGPVHLALSYRFLQTNYNNDGDEDDSSYRWDEGTTQGWYMGIVIKG